MTGLHAVHVLHDGQDRINKRVSRNGVRVELLIGAIDQVTSVSYDSHGKPAHNPSTLLNRATVNRFS